MQKPENFEKFYYAKVGMGEACGCAERIIDVYEFNRKGGQEERTSVPSRSRRFSLQGFLVKYGLKTRRRGGKST